MGRRVLDLERRRGDGIEGSLAASEFDLLKLFADNRNCPLARDCWWRRQITAKSTRSTAPATCA
jgi:hypothetical protein